MCFKRQSSGQSGVSIKPLSVTRRKGLVALTKTTMVKIVMLLILVVMTMMWLMMKTTMVMMKVATATVVVMMVVMMGVLKIMGTNMRRVMVSMLIEV